MAETHQDVVLKVEGVSKRFGGLQALSEVGITIKRGQIFGLIGPNGAGKTTFFNVITGLYTPDAGSFVLAGKPYEPTAVYKVAKAGIARTFQNIRLFSEMTALENVMVGRHVRTHSGLVGAIFRTRSFRTEESAIAASSALKLPLRRIAPSSPEWVRTWRPTITFSSAVISANRRMFWKVRAMPARATSCTACGL